MEPEDGDAVVEEATGLLFGEDALEKRAGDDEAAPLGLPAGSLLEEVVDGFD